MGELFRGCMERRVFAKVLSGLLVILDIFSSSRKVLARLQKLVVQN